MSTEALYFRTFEGEPLEELEAGYVRGLVVPFDREANVADLTPGGVVRYREVWRAGSCARAVREPHRVLLTYTHEESFPNLLGRGVDMAEEARGLVGTFKLLATRADTARDVLTETHKSFSVGFRSLVPRQGTERPGALVERMQCHIAHVAAVVEGAYVGAGVEAVRAAEAEVEAEEADAAARAKAEREELDRFLEAEAARQAELEAKLRA